MSVRETWTNSLTVFIAVLYSVVGFVETPERLSLFVVAFVSGVQHVNGCARGRYLYAV